MTHQPFVSYAQNGEDVVLARALRPDEHRGRWIDVGAADPIIGSVTKAFSERGWTGINIEPNPIEFHKLVHDRPGDTNLRIAIGRVAGTGTLLVAPDELPGRSTMLSEFTHADDADDAEFQPHHVDVRTLSDVWAEHVDGRVDFLKVDVEGMEHDVLASLDLQRFRPRVVVVEATRPNSPEQTHQSWEPMLLQAGYGLALFDGLNRFYHDLAEPELGELLAAPANVLDGHRVYFHLLDLRLQAEEHSAEIDRLQHELDVARLDLDRLRASVAALDPDKAEQAATMIALSDEIAHLDEAHRTAADTAARALVEVADGLDEIGQRERRLAELDHELSTTRARLEVALAAEQRLADLRSSLPFRLARVPARAIRSLTARLRR